METNKIINNIEDVDLSLLYDEDKKELLLFYEYLLFKSEKKNKIKEVKKENAKWDNLEKFLSENRFDLPENYKFDRNEIYDR